MELEIKNYLSRVEKDTLLHQSIHIKKNSKPGRENISPTNQSLQVSYLNLENNKTFVPHKHIFFNRDMPIAQECWIVLSGKVEVIYYDLNDKLLDKVILKNGDCTITYRGGHNYVSLEDNTNSYEVKTGPYLGQ